MNDVFKLAIVSTILFTICFIADWMATNIPWIGYILIIALITYGMARLYRRGWKNN